MKRRKRKLPFIFLTVILVSGTIIYIYSYLNKLDNGIKMYANFGNPIFLPKGKGWTQHLTAGQRTRHDIVTLVTPREPIKSIQDEFDVMCEKYRDLLVSDNFDEKNAAVVKYVNALSKEAEYYYNRLDKSPNDTLWPEMKGVTRSDDLSIQFRMLYILTLAYGTKGTVYYNNVDILLTIKYCLVFMVSSERYSGDFYYGNWWNWQIGVPTYLLDILIIINNKIPREQLKEYTEIISSYVDDSYSRLPSLPENETFHVTTLSRDPASNSQSVGLARVVLGLGILQKNEAKVYESLDSLLKVMQPVTKQDGFYEDGSYIDHSAVPYTGSYGNELVNKMGDILVITQGSAFALASNQTEQFVDIVRRAFVPLIFRGEMIATVKGRAVSKQPLATDIGSDAMFTLLNIAEFGSAKSRKNLRESVKYWMRLNPNYYLTNTRKYHDLKMTMNLLNDPSVLGEEMPFKRAKMYVSMDRFVQHTINYTLAISLYSSRISAFEGLHISDGAIYLYNYDDVQFRNAYWPTVDANRIPGTTVDTTELDDELFSLQQIWSNQKWVGGVASGSQAVVGMSLNKTSFRNNKSLDLIGKKSWFIIEGQIVALGAGITGSTSASIETIIDNRLLNEAYNYEVWSDCGQINGTTKELTLRWLLLKSENRRSSIGYYFPNKETVDIIFEKQYGTYKEININADETMYTGTYRKFIIDHGQTVLNAKYAYVILPGITKTEIMKYATSKAVNIVENSVNFQAVIINEGYLGINFWNANGGTIMGISSNHSLSLLKLTNGKKHHYILSDPTQSGRIIEIKVPKFARVAKRSKGIKYNRENNTFLINLTKSGGASKQFGVINRYRRNHTL